MRSAEQKLLNAVQRPQAYREVVIRSPGARIVLSVWDGAPSTIQITRFPRWLARAYPAARAAFGAAAYFAPSASEGLAVTAPAGATG